MTSAGSYWQGAELRSLGLASFGKDVFVSRQVTIDHPERVHLGDRVRIDAFCCLLAGQPVHIGSNVHLGTSVTINAVAEVTIGSFSGISAGTKLFTSDDDYGGEYLTGPTVPEELSNVSVKPVRLGDHCIIGANSVILPGALLHDGVAVGALSLIKGELAEWGLYGGVPARLLRPRSRALLDKLEQSQGARNGVA